MQPVVRMNRDTYYSMAVIDVSKGASITMPEIPEGKYMSIQPVTEDHRIQAMKYGAGTFDLTTHAGTHLYVIIRLDATFTEAEAKEIQDKIKATMARMSGGNQGGKNKAKYRKWLLSSLPRASPPHRPSTKPIGVGSHYTS